MIPVISQIAWKKEEPLSISHHRVLLNIVRHNCHREADELRVALNSIGVPILKAKIPELAAFNKANAKVVPVYAMEDDRAQRANS